jgi:PIN domain nuclease of toxin-antitoxin system
MRYLLDTHALLWWASGDPKLSPRAAGLLTDPTNELLLSSVVIWEVAIKAALGRLVLGGAPDQLVQRAVQDLGVIPLPIIMEHALGVFHLPSHHQDPFDRLLISQAQTERATLISHDSKMQAYGVPVEW